MRGPEKTKYLADVLQSVANSEEKLRKVEFELRNKVCDYYNLNEDIQLSNLKPNKSVTSDGSEERIFQIYNPEKSDIQGSLKENSSVPCSVLPLDKQEFDYKNSLKVITSILSNEDEHNKHIFGPDGSNSNISGRLSNSDMNRSLQSYGQEIEESNFLDNLEPVDLIPEKEQQNHKLEFNTRKTLSNSNSIPSHDNDQKTLEKYEQDFGTFKVDCEPIIESTSSDTKGEKLFQILQPDLKNLSKNKINNNSTRLLVDRIHSAVESRLRQCLEPYKSRKKRSPLTLTKIQRIPEKDSKNGTNEHASGDCVQQETNENTGMEFVEKLFASYYQRERKEGKDKDIKESRVYDNSQKLSRILDKIASKGLDKVLQCKNRENLRDESKIGNTSCSKDKIEEKLKIEKECEAEIKTKEDNQNGTRKEHRSRRLKCKGFDNNSLQTISEKGESRYNNKRFDNKEGEKLNNKNNENLVEKELMKKSKSPNKLRKEITKLEENRTKICGSDVGINKKLKKSPYMKSFGFRKDKKLGGTIQKKKVRKGGKNKKVRKTRREMRMNLGKEDSKIVCISLKNREGCVDDSEKHIKNEMFEIVKELVFKNKVQGKVKTKRMKKKRKEKVKEGEEKGEKKVRKKKMSKPVWLVPDGHPDGFQPPKTKHRMSLHKLELENFCDEDKPAKNNLSNDKFISRREFVIFLGDKQNNIFGTKSAFKN